MQESTYRCTANMRYSVSCGIFCGIAEQYICFGVILALVGGFAFVGRHFGIFLTLDVGPEVFIAGSVESKLFGGAVWAGKGLAAAPCEHHRSLCIRVPRIAHVDV